MRGRALLACSHGGAAACASHLRPARARVHLAVTHALTLRASPPPRPYLSLPRRYVSLLKQDNLEGVAGVASPTWQNKIVAAAPARSEKDNSTFVDHLFSQGE